MIRLLLIFLFILSYLSSNDESIFTVEQQQYLKDKKEITICFNAKGLPLFGLENGKDVGIFPDTVTLIGKKLGVPFRTVRTKSWEECIALSKNNEVDVSGLVVTSPNKHSHIKPSKEVLLGYFGLVTKIQEPLINDISELKGKKVALFNEQKSVNNFIKSKLPKMEFVMVDSVKEGLKMVAEGKVFAFADETYSLAYYILKFYSNELKIMEKLNNKPVLAGLGIRKNEPKLHMIINKAIEAIPTQEFRNITHKWISVRVEKGFNYLLLLQIVLGFFIVLIISLYWIKRLSKEIERREKAEQELLKLNQNLEKEISIKIQELYSKDMMLQEKTKLAAMGEMLGSIAHQWRRPLSALHINIELLETEYDENKINTKFLQLFIEKNSAIIQYMSQTIDDFQNFYKIDKVMCSYDVLRKVKSVISLHKDYLQTDNIALDIKGKSMLTYGYPNELQQVILNIMNNAHEAHKLRKGLNPFIKINIFEKEKQIHIEILDNAGGIDEDILDKVFEANFSTKNVTRNIGLGLYISKIIIENNMQGQLSVSNHLSGCCVKIILKKEENG